MPDPAGVDGFALETHPVAWHVKLLCEHFPAFDVQLIRGIVLGKSRARPRNAFEIAVFCHFWHSVVEIIEYPTAKPVHVPRLYQSMFMGVF